MLQLTVLQSRVEGKPANRNNLDFTKVGMADIQKIIKLVLNNC